MTNRSLVLVAGLVLGVVGRAEAQAPAEDTYLFFKQNCTSCHTVGGGRLAGPDLKDVTTRQDRAWLTRFVQNPKAVIDSGDAYAQQLLQEAKGVVMTQVPGMTAAQAEKLLDLVEYESGLEESVFAGLQISDRPLTDEDRALGRDLFHGTTEFLSGAPACFSCHSVVGQTAFGGGRLGPDLTSAFGRLEGRNALAAWLSSPPSLVMAPIFRKQPLNADEILALTAYLEERAAVGIAEAEPTTLGFVLTGFAIAAAVLVLFDLFWRQRYRATRKPMVEAAAR